ncbi:MAG: DUF1634 domain-containing protein [Candidatus Caldarchaeum sp.]
MNRSKLETLLSSILMVGIVLSLIVLVAGLASYQLSAGSTIVLSEQYRVSAPSFLDYLKNLPENGLGAKGLMAIGLSLLMLTPYARVVTSLVYFAVKHDIKYLLITAFVSTVLTISLLTH